MKKNIILVMSVAVAIVMSSCSSVHIIPKAVNTIATASFYDLRLERSDYKILNNITAESVIECEFEDDKIRISDPKGSFSLTYEKDKKTGQWELDEITGILRFGFLSNDYGNVSAFQDPEEIARRLAIYNAINMAKEEGADGIIEPLISTNISDNKSSWSKLRCTYTTTVTAKIIKLNTDR